MLRLKKERQKRGWTRSEVSYRARVPLSNYSRIERNLADPYKPELERLSDLFGVSENELMETVEE